MSILMMLTERTRERRFLQRCERCFFHSAFTKMTPLWLPSFGGFFPTEVLQKDGDKKRFHQANLGWPGEAAFDRGVCDVEADADLLGRKILNQRPNIPDGRADVVS